MECMAHEPVLFEDIVCQMIDMISPQVVFCNVNYHFIEVWGICDKWMYLSFCDCYLLQKEGILTLRDLKRCKLSGNFFNILFNLNKFVAFETRDPILVRQVPNCAVYTFICWFV